MLQRIAQSFVWTMSSILSFASVGWCIRSQAVFISKMYNVRKGLAFVQLRPKAVFAQNYCRCFFVYMPVCALSAHACLWYTGKCHRACHVMCAVSDSICSPLCVQIFVKMFLLKSFFFLVLTIDILRRLPAVLNWYCSQRKWTSL